MHLNDNYHKNNVYFCVFLAKHPSNVSKSEEFSKWWTEWYKYTTCPDTRNSIYGDRVLFAPSRLTNWGKYTQWETEITLGDTETISGPLKFEEISTTNPTRAKSKFEGWKHCRDVFLWGKHITTNNWITDCINFFKRKDKEKPEKNKII